MEAHFDEPRGWGYVPDPPPMELERDGVVFYLQTFSLTRRMGVSRQLMAA